MSRSHLIQTGSKEAGLQVCSSAAETLAFKLDDKINPLEPSHKSASARPGSDLEDPILEARLKRCHRKNSRK